MTDGMAGFIVRLQVLQLLNMRNEFECTSFRWDIVSDVWGIYCRKFSVGLHVLDSSEELLRDQLLRNSTTRWKTSTPEGSRGQEIHICCGNPTHSAGTCHVTLGVGSGSYAPTNPSQFPCACPALRLSNAAVYFGFMWNAVGPRLPRLIETDVIEIIM